MKILTVIVTYNATRFDWIEKCLNSLKKSTFNTDIYVIDNASNDNTIDFIKTNFPEITLVQSDVNLGFGKANNKGIEYGIKNNYDYILLLNQDAQIEAETISTLVSFAIKNPLFGILSPLHLEGNGKNIDGEFLREISPKHCPSLFSDSLLNKIKESPYEAEFVCAACWLLSKECIEKVGGFSPTFFHYGEDNNYIQRLYFKGLKAGVVPHTKIYHDRQRPQNWEYGQKQFISKRDYLINLSNPNRPISIKNALKHLKTSLIKSYVKGDRSKRLQIIEEIKYFKKEGHKIEENLKKSIQDKSFAFLEI